MRQPYHDIQLLHLDIQRVVVFAEEYPHLVRQDLGTLLQQQVDVPQRYPLHLGWGAQECHQRRRHLSDELLLQLLSPDFPEVDHDDLDRSKDDTAVDVLELRYDSLADVFALLVVLGTVASQGVEDGDTTPLRAFVQGNEELVENRGGNVEDSGVISGTGGGMVGGRGGVDVGQRSNSVSYDLRARLRPTFIKE